MNRRTVFIGLACLSLLPWVPTWLALLCGIAFGLTGVHPFAAKSKRITTTLLQVSVVGLGAAVNLNVVLEVGTTGILQTLLTISATMLAAHLMALMLKTDHTTSLLIGVGTAICGGSAIAAVAPVIGAKSQATSVALAVVFFLNAIALLLFPAVGHALSLSQTDFGEWSALAIHDTSSVVGATMSYGPQALSVGTTLKLTRALWIVPLTLVISRIAKAGGGAQGVKKPWFIVGFLAMAAIVTFIPTLVDAGQVIARVSRQLLVLTLFLIGSGVDRQAVRSVGRGPMVLGVALWLVVASSTLILIRYDVL